MKLIYKIVIGVRTCIVSVFDEKSCGYCIGRLTLAVFIFRNYRIARSLIFYSAIKMSGAIKLAIKPLSFFTHENVPKITSLPQLPDKVFAILGETLRHTE